MYNTGKIDESLDSFIISGFKFSDINTILMGIGNPKTQNRKTNKADLFLAGITQLITLILAERINKPEHIRSLKPLIA
jgi:hypothetical protein